MLEPQTLTTVERTEGLSSSHSETSSQTVLDVIAGQARRAPQAVALRYGAASISYGSLLAEAQRIGRELVESGVRPGQLVGLCMERGPDMIASVLAIMGAGAAYVPLDPAFPSERLRFAVEDADLRFVVTSRGLSERLPQLGCTFLPVADEIPSGAAATGGNWPLAPRSARDLAYAIYTSGSTGVPKAALVAHGGLKNLARAQRQAFGVSPGDRVLQFAPLSFDASVSEIFVTLAAGAELCLADAAHLTPGPELQQTLRQARATHVTLPPSILAMLDPQALPDLSTVIVAGEACTAAVASQWSIGRRLLNAYGPTEATVCATIYECPAGEQAAPPIGRAIEGCAVRLLDELKQPVPVGQEGEIYIGGAGVALGYLNRPELTAERFVALPGENGHRGSTTRWYRTGDIARQQPDGHLEFVGRRDDQVKIRGVRIELGEIESALERHEAVDAAVVVSCRQDNAPPRLAALVTGSGRTHIQAATLRRWLADHLPAAMMPALVEWIDEIPLTHNGKTDRQQLTKIAAMSRALPPAAAPPRNATELALARIWRRVLRRAEVGVNHDFFGMGGDSLAALEMIAEVERQFDQRLPAQELFSAPTIEKLAARLDQQQKTLDWTPLVPLKLQGSRRPLFCVHPGGGNALCYLPLADALGPDQPLLALQAPGIDGVEEPLTSISAMASRYIEAIQSHEPEGPYRIAGWSFGGLVAYEMACQLERAGQKVELLAILDAGILYSFVVLRALFPNDDVPMFNFSTIDAGEMLAAYSGSVEKAQLIPPGADETMALRVIEIIKANAESVFAFRPQPYGGRALLFRPTEPFENVRVRRDPFDEWSELCAGGVEQVQVAGHHLTMVHPPHVADLAAKLREHLS